MTYWVEYFEIFRKTFQWCISWIALIWNFSLDFHDFLKIILQIALFSIFQIHCPLGIKRPLEFNHPIWSNRKVRRLTKNYLELNIIYKSELTSKSIPKALKRMFYNLRSNTFSLKFKKMEQVSMHSQLFTKFKKFLKVFLKRGGSSIKGFNISVNFIETDLSKFLVLRLS